MVPAATLSVRVAVKGMPKASGEVLTFHGQLKQVSGETATATLKAKLEETGFKRFAAKMTETKLRAATPIVQEAKLRYDTGAFSKLRQEAFLTRKALAGIGGGGGIGSALGGALMPLGKIGTLALAASGPVLDLGGALVSVASSAAAAGAGLGALGLGAGGVAAVGLGGLLAVAVPAVGSLKDLTKAQDAYIQSVETYGVQSSQAESAARKLRTAERLGGKEAVAVVRALDSVKERWTSLTKPGRTAFLGGLSDGLDRLERKLPLLGRSANQSSQVARKGFGAFIKQITGSDFDRFVRTMTRTETRIVPGLSHAFGDWGQVVQRVITATAPSLERVTGVFGRWSDKVLGATSNARELRQDISGLTTQFLGWVHLLTATGYLLTAIFTGGADSGLGLVRELTQQFREWGDWIDSHREAVSGFFEQTAGGTKELAEILGHTAQSWFLMARAMEPVEMLILKILDGLNRVHVFGQSMLTVLLGGFALLKVALAALKVKDLVEGFQALRAVTATTATATAAETAALEGQAAAAGAAAVANAELAASNEAVAVSAQQMSLAVPEAAAAGQLSLLGTVPANGAAAAEAQTAKAAAGAAASGGIGGALSRLGARAVASKFAPLGAVAGGYFAAEFGAKAIEGITGKDLLENQSLLKSLTHGFNTSKQPGKMDEDEGLAKARAEEVTTELHSGMVARLPDIRKLAVEGTHSISEAWAKGSPGWRRATAENMHAVVSAIRAGEDQGLILAQKGQHEIEALMHNSRLVTGSDPFGIAKGFTDSWQRAKTVTDGGIRAWQAEMHKMPPSARAVATQTTLAQVHEAERAGTLTKGSYAKLRSAVVAELRGTRNEALGQLSQLVKEGGIKGDEFAEQLGGSFISLAGNAQGAMANIGFSVSAMLKTLGGKAPKYNVRKALHSLPQLKPMGRQTGGGIVPGTGSGDRPGFMGEAGAYVLNREATKAYGFLRGGGVPLALEPGERYFTRSEAARIGTRNLAEMNASVPRFRKQKGGSLGPEPQIAGPAGALRSVGQAAVHQVYEGAKEYAAKHKPTMAAGPTGAGGPVPPGSVRQWLTEALKITGHFSPANLSALYGRTMQESGGNPRAINNWDSNAAAGHPSQGLLQTIPETFNAYKMKGHGEILNPIDNAIAAIRYMFDRYGHVVGPSDSGYELGGLVQALLGGGSVGSRLQGAADPRSRSKWAGWTPDGRWSPGSAQRFLTGGEALDIPTTIHPPAAPKTAAEKASPTKAVQWAMRHLGDSDQWGYPGEWCGAFLGADMEAIGLTPPSGYPAASAWASYGSPLGRDHVQAGAILDYGSAHVAMAISSSQQIQGNNSSGVVGTSDIGGVIGGSTLTAVRWPPYGTGPGAGSEPTEKVPSVFHGAVTRKLSIGSSTPKTLHGVQREITRREGELKVYRRALAAAKGMPATSKALQANVTVLETRLTQLRRAAHKLREEKAKRKFTGKLGRALGKVTGYEQDIEAKQRVYSERSQFAEQTVGLEPTEPILASNATDAQREAAEKLYVADLSSYIANRETPAYAAVLGSEADWRNTILSGQGAATGFEHNQEFRIRLLARQIDAINALTEKARKDVADWRVANAKKKDPDKQLPDWLRGELGTARDQRATLPMLRFQEQERRKVLGTARESFYGGVGDGVKPVHPPAPPLAGTGSFEQAMIEVQGVHWPGQHEHLGSLPANRGAGMFGGAIWDTQTSIEELGLRIRQAQAGISAGSAPEVAGKTEREELLEGLLREANQRKAISAALNPTLAQFEASYPVSYMGAFAKGGVAMVGERGPELAHLPSGTRIHSNADTERMLGGDVAVIVNGDIRQEPDDLRDPVEVLRRHPGTRELVREMADIRPGVSSGGAGRLYRP